MGLRRASRNASAIPTGCASSSPPTRASGAPGRACCSSLAIALAFVALARPQYGRGTRLIPATNLDVVIVLDYSKSMYARDVAPSRILRAKAEVGAADSRSAGRALRRRRVRRRADGLPAHVRRRRDRAVLSPARAERHARRRHRHRARARARARAARARSQSRTSTGASSCWSPTAKISRAIRWPCARSGRQEGTTIDVVQIGGRTPEPIPESVPTARSPGYRTDEQGKPLTTVALGRGRSAARADRQAAPAARSCAPSEGTTGIDTISRS